MLALIDPNSNRFTLHNRDVNKSAGVTNLIKQFNIDLKQLAPLNGYWVIHVASSTNTYNGQIDLFHVTSTFSLPANK